MTFEIPVLYKLCKDVLIEDRHGTGIKAEFFVETPFQIGRKYHISDTHGGCYGPRKSIEIDNVHALIDAFYCFDLSEGRIQQ